MIEDELRHLLSERADDLPANARRVAEVRHRITRVRRRRAAAGALALVLLALTGTLLTRLPGRPDALPVGVPPGPYFTAPGLPAVVPGYNDVSSRPYEFDGPVDEMALTPVTDGLRYLVVVRCERAGVLTLQNRAPGSSLVRVNCSERAGDHLEGLLELDAAQARSVFEQRRDTINLRLTPGSPGRWKVTLLESKAADTLLATRFEGPPLVDGTRTPDGGTFPLTVRAGGAVQVGVDCAAGVVLELTVPGGTLAVADCNPLVPRDDPAEFSSGTLRLLVPPGDVARVGLRVGRTVQVTVRPTGRDTDQWRIAYAQ